MSEGNSGTACDVASNVFNSELGYNNKAMMLLLVIMIMIMMKVAIIVIRLLLTYQTYCRSNYLAHYGLDGPLAEYQPPPSEYGNDAPDEPSEVDD